MMRNTLFPLERPSNHLAGYTGTVDSEGFAGVNGLIGARTRHTGAAIEASF
jgi:hypothetical protein